MHGLRSMLTGIWLNRVGLSLSFLGSLLIAFSIGEPPSQVYQDYRGRRVSLAAFSRPWALRLGLALLSFGFGLSLIATYL
jgi:hypothetical protein